jgi:putative flippase GtrA
MIALLRLMDTSVVRFAMVSGLGLAIDLAAAWALTALAGVPIALAVVGGFLLGAAFNYVLHEVWTFPGGRPSAMAGSLYLAVVLATLGVRVGVASGLRRFVFTDPGMVLVPLVIAVGCSFLTQFALSRSLVFRRSEQ